MESILGEIKLWAINFAPKGWALCDGSMLQIQSNAALYSLLGTAYGGNGTTTFALPDLRGRVPVGTGVNTGIPYNRGTYGGQEYVTLDSAQMPQHSHVVNACSGNGNQAAGLDHHLAAAVTRDASAAAVPLYTNNFASGLIALSPQTFSTAGESEMHNNMQPYQALNYYICTLGLYPQRP